MKSKKTKIKNRKKIQFLLYLVIMIWSVSGMLFYQLYKELAQAPEVNLVNQVEAEEEADKFCSLPYVDCEDEKVEVTAYCHTGYRTYSGIYPYEGVIAIKIPDSRFQIGDLIKIKELNRTFTALDRLPSYQKADLDIYFNDCQKAKEFGRKNLTYEIIK